MKLIYKDSVLNVLEKTYNEEIDTYTRKILDMLKSNIDSLEVKEVDFLQLEQEVKDFCYKFDDRKEKWYNMTPHDKNIITNPTWGNFAMQLAKHFFELGMQQSKK